MAIREFRLPDPGEGLVEADIVTWRVAVGDTVALNDIVVEVETSKSLVELPSPYAGTVRELLVAEGDTVDVGRPIIAIDDGADAPAEAPPRDTAPIKDVVPDLPETQVDAVTDGGDAPAPGGRVSVLVGYGPKTTEAKRRPRKHPAPSDAARAEAHDLAAETFATDAPVSRRIDEREPLHADTVEAKGGPLPDPTAGPIAEPESARISGVGPAVLAKPPVRKLAKDLGVDLRRAHRQRAGRRDHPRRRCQRGCRYAP